MGTNVNISLGIYTWTGPLPRVVGDVIGLGFYVIGSFVSFEHESVPGTTVFFRGGRLSLPGCIGGQV